MSTQTKLSDATRSVLSKIKKQFGDGVIMRMSDKQIVKVESISTGSLSLDLALGVGGVPKGRIVEIFGAESGGKTTLSLHIAAEAQKLGGQVCFIDAEHAFDPGYAEAIGVNVDSMFVSQPDYGEMALEIADQITESGDFSLVIIDSVAALVPRVELDGEMGDQQIGLQARMMSKAMRKLTAKAQKTKTCLIFINQIREKVGVAWGNPETTTGGRALKFYSSVRIDVRKRAQIKDKEGHIIAIDCQAKVAKNKVAAPFKVAKLRINFGTGIDTTDDLFNLCLETKLIKKSGSMYKLPSKLNPNPIRGQNAVKIWLVAHSKYANMLKKAVLKRS